MNKIASMVATSVLMAAAGPSALAKDLLLAEAAIGNYEVTITNTSSLSFTPLLVVAHSRDIALFRAGAEPSAELAEMAESGSTAGLQAVLDTVPDDVGDVGTTQGLLGPGESVTVQLSAEKRFDRVSVVAMLLPTNDSFIGLNSVSLPRAVNRPARYSAVGYDAGSEPNDELCASIPGPQCGGVGLSPDEGGEGYVRVSPGIAGDADLSVRAYDWRNPVASISVVRMP